MRYERKYLIEGLSKEEVIDSLRLHPMGFKTLFPGRRINNIYLDTIDLSFLNENIVGAPERKKYRIRWYGEPFIESYKTILEIKIKMNELGTKKHIPFPNPINPYDIQGLATMLPELLPENLFLEPVLNNEYFREYFGDTSRKLRVTIDDKMRFAPVYQYQQERQFGEVINSIVVEVKYDQEDDDVFREFAQKFPFRISKNSKYVTGMHLLS